jgi:pSer/pThr/pTyr-binding forkhead associated (FHA) protein
MTSSAETPFPANLSEAWLEMPDGSLFWLTGRCSVGRQKDNDLVIEDTALSRYHALLMPTARGCEVTDLRSSNGTYVNKAPVTRPVTLKDTDEVRFGNYAVRYRCTRPPMKPTASSGGDVTRRIDDVGERACWLLLVDVAGYSGLIAKIGSEAAVRLLRTWIEVIRPPIVQNGGQINAYVGDAILAWWPADGPDVAASVKRALGALEAARAVSPLAFRVVLHLGPSLFARSERGEEMSGQEVNFLFRAEKIAKEFGVGSMLSEAAAGALSVLPACTLLGSRPVAGIPGTFQFYSLPA